MTYSLPYVLLIHHDSNRTGLSKGVHDYFLPTGKAIKINDLRRGLLGQELWDIVIAGNGQDVAGHGSSASVRALLSSMVNIDKLDLLDYLVKEPCCMDISNGDRQMGRPRKDRSSIAPSPEIIGDMVAALMKGKELDADDISSRHGVSRSTALDYMRGLVSANVAIKIVNYQSPVRITLNPKYKVRILQ